MKDKYKSFAELNKAVNKDPFTTFLEMSTPEKADYLKKHGITWGADYLGRYCEKTRTVRIDSINNPFTGKAIEGAIQGRPSFSDGTQIIVRLKTGKIKNQKSSPTNIFGFEYIGQLSKKRFVDMSVNASVTTLQEENKKLKSKNDALRRKSEIQAEELYEYKNETKELQGTIKTLSSRLNNLRLEKERAEKLGEKITRDLQLEKDLLQQKLKENNKLSSIVIDRNIAELLHVTNINNLENILYKGIVPVALLDNTSYRNDRDRHDKKLECSSLSISRVNFRYLRRVSERDPGQTYICIYIKPSILLDNNTKYYCHHNAATGSISYYTGRGLLTTADDFEYMFADTVEYTTVDGKQNRYRTSAHKQNWTTSDQAEILYEGIIQPSSFIGIAFPTEEILKDYMHLLNRYGICGIVDRNLRF